MEDKSKGSRKRSASSSEEEPSEQMSIERTSPLQTRTPTEALPPQGTSISAERHPDSHDYNPISPVTTPQSSQRSENLQQVCAPSDQQQHPHDSQLPACTSISGSSTSISMEVTKLRKRRKKETEHSFSVDETLRYEPQTPLISGPEVSSSDSENEAGNFPLKSGECLMGERLTRQSSDFMSASPTSQVVTSESKIGRTSKDSNIPITSDSSFAAGTSRLHGDQLDLPIPSSSDSNIPITSEIQTLVHSSFSEGTSDLHVRRSPPSSTDSNMPIAFDTQTSVRSPSVAGPSDLHVRPTDSPIPSPSTGLNMPIASDIQSSVHSPSVAGPSDLHVRPTDSPIPSPSTDSNMPIASDTRSSIRSPSAEETSDLHVRHSDSPMLSPSTDSNMPITSDTQSSVRSPSAEETSDLHVHHSDSPIPSPLTESNMPIPSNTQPLVYSPSVAGPSGLNVRHRDLPVLSTSSTYPLQNPLFRNRSDLLKKFGTKFGSSESRSASDTEFPFTYESNLPDTSLSSKGVGSGKSLEKKLDKKRCKYSGKMLKIGSPSYKSPSLRHSEHSSRYSESGSDKSAYVSSFERPSSHTSGSPRIPLEVPPTPDIRYDEVSMSEFIETTISALFRPRIPSLPSNTTTDADTADNAPNPFVPKTPGGPSGSDEASNASLPNVGDAPLKSIIARSSSAPPNLQQSRSSGSAPSGKMVDPTSSAGPSQTRPYYKRMPEIYGIPTFFDPDYSSDSFRGTPPTPRDPEIPEQSRHFHRTPKSSSSSSSDDKQ